MDSSNSAGSVTKGASENASCHLVIKEVSEDAHKF